MRARGRACCVCACCVSASRVCVCRARAVRACTHRRWISIRPSFSSTKPDEIVLGGWIWANPSGFNQSNALLSVDRLTIQLRLSSIWSALKNRQACGVKIYSIHLANPPAPLVLGGKEETHATRFAIRTHIYHHLLSRAQDGVHFHAERNREDALNLWVALALPDAASLSIRVFFRVLPDSREYLGLSRVSSDLWKRSMRLLENAHETARIRSSSLSLSSPKRLDVRHAITRRGLKIQGTGNTSIKNRYHFVFLSGPTKTSTS